MNAAPPSLIGEGAIELLCKTASRAPDGAIVEVGVYKGGSAWYLTQLAESQNRSIYLYDTFTGIPYQGPDDRHKVGDFSDTKFETIRDMLPYAHVIQGIFPESAVEMDPVAFVHLDCDQYQSIIDSCTYLLPRMVPGGIIWFDDAPNLAGAERAVQQLFHGKVQRVQTGQSMVVL